MNKYILVLFALFFLTVTAFAQNEITLKELGYSELTVSGIETIECKEFIFSLTDSGTEFFPIISIKAQFKPTATGEALVDLHLNDSLFKRFGVKDFRCQGGECWARVRVDRNYLREENKLKLCAKTGKSTTQIILSKESLIGYYKIPLFKKENFHKCILLESGECVESYNAFQGEDLNIKLSLTNSGTALSVVEINNRIEKAGTRPVRKEIGETHFNGVIGGGKTRVLNYTIRVEEAVPMSLPPAIATFHNVFGERETIKSNLVFIYPEEQPEIKAALNIESINHSKKEALLSLTLFNQEKTTIQNTTGKILLGDGLELINGRTELNIESLAPKSAQSIKARIKAPKAGDYSVWCEYSAGEQTSECAQTTISFHQEETIFLLGAMALFVIITIAIYFFIQTREEYSE